MGLPILPHYPSLDPAAALYAVKAIHYAYPPVLLTYFAGALSATFLLQQKESSSVRHVRRGVILWATLGVLITYVLESVMLLCHSLVQSGWWATEDTVVYSISSILAWGVLHLSLLEDPKPVWYPYWGAWIIGLTGELFIVILSMKPEAKSPQQNMFEYTEHWLRYLRLAIMLFLPIVFWGLRKRLTETEACNTVETAPLLGQPGSNAGYGAVTQTGSEDDDEHDEHFKKEREFEERVRKRREEGGWLEYAASFKIFWPHIWPQKNRVLQLHIALVGCCLLVERALNVLVPLQMGRVTNALMSGGLGHIPWTEVSLFILIRWLGSGAGIPAVQRYLWVPMDQYAYRCITTAAYNHVMSLSQEFHSNKDTGEIYSAVQQGRSVTGFVDMVLFSVLPMLADIIVAFGYFYITFGIYMALIVAVISCVYVWVTSRLNRSRVSLRRNYTKTARKETQLMWQSMTSWETVAYFNRIGYEQDRYSGAIINFQKAERDFTDAMLLLNVTQSAIFTIGLLLASFLAVYQVTKGGRKVGDFVALLSYWAQISGPLSFFTNMYRRIQELMLDAERLLELMLTPPSVVTKPGAKELIVTNGEVEFQNVSFGYDPRKVAIKDMNFHAPGGKITALVGSTGGGKSTCLKLLFRFYDVCGGEIMIDGQNIQNVTLSSLREQIGVVPQDPRLFNESIMENLRYARLDASDEDIYSACRSAAIHDKILTFPDGYLSKVGEGGVKLSGGERQRIAIARAILKNPKLVLLDEATSSVDVTTERLIQEGLNKLAAGRTMFVIAHRLTTIMHADEILVLDDGKIVEHGKHEELLKLKGKYTELWHGNLLPRANSENLINDIEPVLCSTATIKNPTTGDTTRERPTFAVPLNIKFAPLIPKRSDLFHPHTYPRVPTSMSAPKLTYLQQPANESVGLVTPNDKNTQASKSIGSEKLVKHDSTLKPEAKEFIPASVAAPPLYANSLLSSEMPLDTGTQPPVSPGEFQSFLDENKKQEFANNGSCDLAEVTGNEETTEQKHRRRRHRRRSRSSRSSSGNDHPSVATESAMRQNMRNKGNLVIFHPSGPEIADAYHEQYTEPAESGIDSTCDDLTHADSTSTLISRTSGVATFSDSISQSNRRTGLNETTPNISLSLKRSFTGREGRGASASKWKLQGKPLLSGNVDIGYGAANLSTGTTHKDSTAKAQINSTGNFDLRSSQLDKSKSPQS